MLLKSWRAGPLTLWRELLVAGGVTDYALADAWTDFQTSLLTLLYDPVSFFRIREQSGKRGRALMSVRVHRLFHAAVACDAAAALDPNGRPGLAH